MGEQVKTPAIVIAALVLILGIIHLSVAAAFVSKYNRYKDVFQQPVGLSGFNIVIGIYGIVIGILGLVTITRMQAPLGN
jgi:formate hydrogenlyase subunit 3/multisubunit Na+/H+ antiporter MnhD subunit